MCKIHQNIKFPVKFFLIETIENVNYSEFKELLSLRNNPILIQFNPFAFLFCCNQFSKHPDIKT